MNRLTVVDHFLYEKTEYLILRKALRTKFFNLTQGLSWTCRAYHVVHRTHIPWTRPKGLSLHFVPKNEQFGLLWGLVTYSQWFVISNLGLVNSWKELTSTTSIALLPIFSELIISILFVSAIHGVSFSPHMF